MRETTRPFSLATTALLLCFVLGACTTPSVNHSSSSSDPAKTLVAYTSPTAPIPTILPTYPTRSEVDEWATLLSYYPFDDRQASLPYIVDERFVLLDISQLREDQKIPPITGASSRQDKLGLSAALNMVKFGSGDLDPKGSTFFGEWGWDIADVKRAMIVPLDEVTVLEGDFKPEITQAFAKKGFKETKVNGFTVFSLNLGVPTFALGDSRILMYGQNSAVIEHYIRYGSDKKDPVYRHASVRDLLSHTQGAWFVLLGRAGDMQGYTDRSKKIQDELPKGFKDYLSSGLKPDEEYQLGWDWMVAGLWSPADDRSSLHFLYHYDTVEEARKDVALGERSLTEGTTGHGTPRRWADVVTLNRVHADGSTLIAEVTTANRSLLATLVDKQDWSFLPIRVVKSASPKPAAWTDFVSEKGKFSVRLPGFPNQSLQKSLAEGMSDIDLVSARKGDTTFAVASLSYPRLGDSTEAKDLLDSVRDGIVRTSKGRLSSEADVSLGKFPGRELHIWSVEGATRYRVRVYWVPPMAYQLTVAAPGESAFLPQWDEFFDSFKLR